MPFHSRILLSCLMLFGASHVHAQSQMTIDGNCNFPLATSGTSVSINPASGNVTVSSQSGVNCTAAGVSLSLPTSATVGTTFNVSWNATGTSGTSPCTPSGGGNSNWANQGALPSNGNRTITAPGTAANNVAFTITCATGSTPVSDTKTMNFTGGGGGGASVDLVTPSSVAVGQNFTISWNSTGTSGTTPCTPSGGGTTNWSTLGSLEPTGQRTITAPATAGSATFTISCATGGTPVSDSETVTFFADVVCTGVGPPPGISAGAPQNWTSLYGGIQFPQPLQTLADIPMTPGAARVIRIIPQLQATPSQNLGSLVYTSFQHANVVASISPCPNDFRQAVLNTATQRCFMPASEQIDVPYRLTGFTPLYCNLNPGQTYYINLHVGTSSSPDGTGAFCASGTCNYRGGTQAGLISAGEPADD